MKSILFTLCFLPLLAISQETTIVKEIEKTISVDVNQDDDGQRDIKIISASNGDEKVFRWKDNGTIPDEIKSQLEAEGIDIKILDHANNVDGEDVEVHIDRKEMKSPKKIVIKMMEDDGESQVMEWDGDGKIPAKMQNLLDEHDIDIEKMRSDSEVRKTRIKKIKKERKEKRKRAQDHGRDMNQAQKKKFKRVTIDVDGNRDVNEWEGDGNKEIKIHKKGDHKMIWIGDEGEDENIFVMKGSRKRSSDAYLGAAISSSATEGALIEEITENGPAAKSNLKKGDVIQKVNGARIKSVDDLLDLLSYYEPKDEVQLTISRNGSEEKINLELGKRPKAARL